MNESDPPVLGMASRYSMRPHRGALILTFGIVGLFGGLLSLGCCQGLLVLEVFGILAILFAREDLRQMRAGRMDTSGDGPTRAGLILAIIGLVFAALSIAILLLMLIFVGISAAIPAVSGSF